MQTVKNSNLGYPRIGEKREWKKLLESFWTGKLGETEFLSGMKQIRLHHIRKQKDAGIDLIPVGDFTFYDHVLDTAVMFGLVPERFQYDGGPVSLETYFAMARGNKDTPACEMTKWFNTNYHYIVPELEHFHPVLVENRPLQAYLEAKEELGVDGKPVLIGPYSFIKLSKGYSPEQFANVLEKLLPPYAEALQQLKNAGVHWIQIDEPCLTGNVSDMDIEHVKNVYKYLHEAVPQLDIILQTYFDAVDVYDQIVKLPVKAIGLDFVHGKSGNVKALFEHGFPNDKVLMAGVIDGRNIWGSDLLEKMDLLTTLSQVVSFDRIVVQPSCSLLHVPVSTKYETKLDSVLKEALAFADEKLKEIVLLAEALRVQPVTDDNELSSQLKQRQAAISELNQSTFRSKNGNKPDAAHATKRNLPFEERQKIQQEKWKLPLLPTTTIGSFPQTVEVRKARQLWRAGEWSDLQYHQFIQEQIQTWIEIQEDIGLDVFVHGEFERTDMVEFFGEKLDGFAFTQNGWVQSYGSRCVKPPVIYGNVHFISPMTVKETLYAQSLTSKPVKGMLTGPITILNWSFVRDDISRKEVAFQIALALQKEVEALEAAGIQMIQVDEPALREGLPLKKEQWDDYLSWAVEAFRICTSTVKDTTQIHTHMCYCEFQDIIDSIKALDADVISIETSRSHGELISSFENDTYDKGIGLGIYDIHSPRVPGVDEMKLMIERALRVLPDRLFWINPDCGLKTRGINETVQALKNMVQVAREVRKDLHRTIV